MITTNIKMSKTLIVTPNRAKKFDRIDLTENGDSYITLEWLTPELDTYGKTKFKEIFDLHPNEPSHVVMYGKNIESRRWHKSYLHYPKYNESIFGKRSYMYSSTKDEQHRTLPTLLEPFLEHMNAGQKQHKYNNVIVNWYLDGSNFLQGHSDCKIGMVPDANVSILTLNEDDEQPRKIQFNVKQRFYPKRSTYSSVKYSKIELTLPHGCIIKMHGDVQYYFKHRIPRQEEVTSSRVSISFRMFDENAITC